MPYASGETPEVGDRISNREDRIGAVAYVSTDWAGNLELTIRWDDGVVAIRYKKLEDFTLIRRAPERE
jgi:hypothetical protein